jgi:hypothetical protein
VPPTITVNVLAVLACVIVAMPLGFLWFGPLFGKAYRRHMGVSETEQPGAGAMVKPLVIYVIGSFLMAFVLTHSIEIWRPSTWNVGPDRPAWVFALNGALWTWVGYVLPIQIARVAWEGKAWGFVFILTSFDLTRLLIFSFILAYWR